MAKRHRTPALEYKVGDSMWLSSADVPLEGALRKPHSGYIRTFQVSRIINPVAVKLDLSSSLNIYPVFHVSKLKSVRHSLMQFSLDSAPSPRMVDGGPV